MVILTAGVATTCYDNIIAKKEVFEVAAGGLARAGPSKGTAWGEGLSKVRMTRGVRWFKGDEICARRI